MTESATLRRPAPLPARLQVGLVAALIAVAAAGWAVTGDRMSGMDAGPGTDLGGFGWFVVVWVTMMAAMMLPSVTPMVLGHARLERGSGDAAPGATTGVFVAGYLLTWAAVGVVAYGIFEGIRGLGWGFLGWHHAGPYVAGGVIVAAAVYRLSSVKSACLGHCREPATLLDHWRPGAAGAARMGIEHGAFCVGSSWALMAGLFALGVMSVGWMAFVAALIAAEKLLPWPTAVTRGIAILLAVLGLAVAFAPEDVPGLTIPGSSAAMNGMKSMHMAP